MIKELKGKTALITGGAKRIGRNISMALAEQGVNIIVHYSSSQEEANDLVADLSSYGVQSWLIKAEFTKPSEYETLIKRAIELAGHLDILVNNASIFSADKIEDADLKNLALNIEVNAWAPLVLIREFASLTNGSVINILDSKISRYDLTHTSYILSKHMLSVITKMCALKFAPKVCVNAIAPGLILPPSGKDENYLNNLANFLPLKRHGEPEDIAAAVIFLLKSNFITGQTIFVDGGYHLAE